MISIFRELKLKIIVHANSSLYLLPLSFDNSWSIFNKNVLKKITTRKLLKKSILYWNGRLRGYSNYEDAKIAYKKKTYLKNSDNFNYDNVILLHIFRDSPFNVIDKNRIFSDYIDWIDKTLRIIKNSKENWIIKPHPNFERWGEDSFKTYKNIFDNVFNNHQSKNIKYIFENISNIELLKRAKRIVTFSGTVHVEAACLGLKPIVISRCTLSNFGNNFVLKPQSLNQYSKLLLMDSKSSIFRLSEKKKKYAKFMIFIRENVINLRKDLNSSSIYRADKKKIRDAEFYNIYRNLDKNIDFLRRTGKFIEKNNNTIAKKYFNI
jgi:predicted glycosyltransferase